MPHVCECSRPEPRCFAAPDFVGEHYLGIALELRVHSPAERDRALAAIDALVLPLEESGGPFSAIRRVGTPWLDAWLERQTGTATKKFMPLFGIFLMALVLLVYRSWRALAAIVLTLGAVVAMAVGLADIFGWSNTVVSDHCPADGHGDDDRHARLHSFPVHGAGRCADAARTSRAGARQ